MEAATVLTNAFEPSKLPAGLYVARSDSAAYPILRAVGEVGMGEVVGESYSEGGVKVVTVRVSGGGRRVRANAVRTMQMSRSFLVNVLKDYNDWQEKWWREVVQNSVDARAKNVELSQEEQADGTVIVSCTDDGQGMDAATILGKFLVFGESTKSHGGMAGGFGKAKEMLLLPWIGWRVESNGQMFEGVGNQYEDQPQPSSLARGTRLSVRMPADMCTSAWHAAAFLEKCNIPGVKFTVQGKPTQASQRPGKVIRELNKANVHYNKSAQIHGIFVRTHGIYMFSDWLSSDVPGALFVEITAPSIEVLSSNRDGFRDRDLSKAIDSIQNEVAVNVLSALEKKSTISKQRYKGSGMLNPDAASSEVLANIPSLPAAKGGAIQVGKEASTEIATLVVDVVVEYARQAERRGMTPRELWGGGAGAIDAETAALMVESVPILGQQHMENVTKQLVWSPDFYVLNKIEGFRVPKRFTPDGMPPMILRLAKLWAELCRYVLIQLNCSKTFGVGFAFDERASAMHSGDLGENWLLLNPFAVPTEEQRTVIVPEGPILSHAKDKDLRSIYASAIHEATHMVNGLTDHNERFSSAFTRNVAICADGFKVAKKIATLVGKRKVAGEQGDRAEKEKAPKRGKGKLSKQDRQHVENFLTTVATVAAGYIADKRGEQIQYASRAQEDWSIYSDALDVVHNLVRPSDPSWSTYSNAGIAAELLYKGFASLDATTHLKVDVGNCSMCVVVMLRATDDAEAAWQAMLDDFGQREFEVFPGYGNTAYTVYFERW